MKGDYSHLRQTAGSLVDIELDSVKNLGSNLPGIGAIDIVKLIKERILVRESRLFRLNTSAEIRLQTEASNRVTTEEISLYLRRLCDAAESATSSSPAYSLDQSAVCRVRPLDIVLPCLYINRSFREFQKFLSDLETARGRIYVDRAVNAKAIDEELKAIWKVIRRSLEAFQVPFRLFLKCPRF